MLQLYTDGVLICKHTAKTTVHHQNSKLEGISRQIQETDTSFSQVSDSKWLLIVLEQSFQPLDLKFSFFLGRWGFIYTQGLYKDRHSYGRSTMSTQLVGVFNFLILKFEESKSVTGVTFYHQGSFFRDGGGVHPSGAVSLPSGSFSK